jgi:hypothetical protein
MPDHVNVTFVTSILIIIAIAPAVGSSVSRTPRLRYVIPPPLRSPAAALVIDGRTTESNPTLATFTTVVWRHSS